MNINHTLNEVLVRLFRDINTLEERAIRTEEYRDVTSNDMHVMEAIGPEGAKNMTSVEGAGGYHGNTDHIGQQLGQKRLCQQNPQ